MAGFRRRVEDVTNLRRPSALILAISGPHRNLYAVAGFLHSSAAMTNLRRSAALAALTVALISFVTVPARADEALSQPAAAMRQRGNTKTVAGVSLVSVAVVFSTVLTAVGVPRFFSDASREQGSFVGLNLLISSHVVGTALFAAGMPLLVSGQHDRDRAERLASPPALVTLRY